MQVTVLVLGDGQQGVIVVVAVGQGAEAGAADEDGVEGSAADVMFSADIAAGTAAVLWLCGRNSCGSLLLVEVFEADVLWPLTVLVTPPMIIPTTLVAS